MTPSYTIQEIVDLLFSKSCEIIGDRSQCIEGVSDLASSGSKELSFFANMRYAQDLKKSQAGAIIISSTAIQRGEAPSGKNYIIHENPTEAFQAVLNLFRGGQSPQYTGFHGIHPTAIIHPSARVDASASVGPYAVIDEEAEIGPETVVLAHAYIGRKVRIGQSCLIHAHAVIREECILGDRVILQPGAVIGSCGFGYSTDKRGTHTKLAHWGNVVLEDNTEIGANSTIDRARFASTRIGAGTKIDNLVQLGHNVEVGRHCFLVAQVGVAGSTKIGNHVVLAGKAAVNGHIEIGDCIMVAACSGVSKTLKEPGKYSGMPAQKLEDHNRNAVFLRKISTLFDRVKALEDKLSP